MTLRQIIATLGTAEDAPPKLKDAAIAAIEKKPDGSYDVGDRWQDFLEVANTCITDPTAKKLLEWGHDLYEIESGLAKYPTDQFLAEKQRQLAPKIRHCSASVSKLR